MVKNCDSALLARIEQYDVAHQSPMNRGLHFIGIPLLTISIAGGLSRLSCNWPVGFSADAAWPVWIVLTIWSLFEDWRIAVAPLIGILVCYAIGCQLPASVLSICLGGGAGCLLLGHLVFERSAPQFLSHPFSVFTAPAWLFVVWLGRPRLRSGIESASHVAP